MCRSVEGGREGVVQDRFLSFLSFLSACFLILMKLHPSRPFIGPRPCFKKQQEEENCSENNLDVLLSFFLLDVCVQNGVWGGGRAQGLGEECDSG